MPFGTELWYVFGDERDEGCDGNFVGHDHVNDYIVNYYDIALAYGHFSGWIFYIYPKPVINGVRVVLLKEDKESLIRGCIC